MKRISSIGVMSGLILIYMGIYVFLSVGTNNMALKNNTYINKTFANIKVFEDSLNKTSVKDRSDLLNDKWSSPNFPNSSYKKVSITYGNETEPIFNSPTTINSYIYISSDSH